MRLIQVSFIFALLLSVPQVFAHGDHNGPCSSYEATCKSDPSVTGAADKKAKWKAMHECVKAAAAADATNGPACTAAMAKHHEHHMEKQAAPSGQ
jgi:hypothetical protein